MQCEHIACPLDRASLLSRMGYVSGRAVICSYSPPLPSYGRRALLSCRRVGSTFVNLFPLPTACMDLG